MTIIYIFIFGIFGIVSSTLGIIIHDNEIITHGLILSVENNEIVISLSLVAIVIAGLLGGPAVGLGAGIIVGIHLFFLGGVGWFANVDRKSTRLNSSHVAISYAVFCLKKKKKN